MEEPPPAAPAFSRRNSSNSNVSSGDALDADLIGMSYDADGHPLDMSTSYPTSGLTDMIQTWISGAPRLDIDLLDRKLKQASERVRQRVRRTDTDQNGDAAAIRRQKIRADRRAEVKRLREKVSLRIDKVSKSWAEQKNVRFRDKLCFVIGVMNLVISSLIFAYKPEWMPISYTIQTSYFLPLRVYSYTRKKWTYFLFDYCEMNLAPCEKPH